MPTVAKYRRTWFALLREAGVEPEDRHAVQEAWAGKPSLRDWTPRDYDTAIGGLQRILGQHPDERAHVREDRELPETAGDGTVPTDAQCRYVEHLCDQIEWWKGREEGPALYVGRHFLSGPENELRRQLLSRTTGPSRWRILSRLEIAGLIRALIKMSRRPLESKHDRGTSA